MMLQNLRIRVVRAVKRFLHIGPYKPVKRASHKVQPTFEDGVHRPVGSRTSHEEWAAAHLATLADAYKVDPGKIKAINDAIADARLSDRLRPRMGE